MTPPPVRTQRSVVTLCGTTVELEYRLDPAEHRRRQEVGLAAVTELHVLAALMELPVGISISPPQCLADGFVAALSQLPPGCVEVTPDAVTRLVIPALTPIAVMAHGCDWRAALERAGRFAPYCMRSVLVSDEPTPMQLSEASFYGIGVLQRAGSDRHTLLEPEPFTGGYSTPASWAFAEQAYAQLSQDPLQA